ncbi:MAG: hypothetical protein WA919_06020 [Coleofasciculaceae cyanobacterium]
MLGQVTSFTSSDRIMSRFCFRLYHAISVAILTLTTGCSWTSIPKQVSGNDSSTSPSNSLVSAETPSLCQQVDPFSKAISKASSAANLAQSAQSPQDWDLVVSRWIQAIESMQAIPAQSPKRTFAQKKVTEYLQNLEVAQRKASNSNSQLPFTSFNNQILDEQLLLYLSYIAAVGPPDVLIVGSSRALQGVDPQQLQQALARFNKGNLKIFNFGVNGATAQLVDFQLQQLLSSEQLPRLIIFADGVRAFNSGRTDKTFNSLIQSTGYQRLLSGVRPTLPNYEAEAAPQCEVLQKTEISSLTADKSVVPVALDSSSTDSNYWRLTRVSYEATESPLPFPAERLLLTQLKGADGPQRLSLVHSVTGYSSFAVDANGFLPVDSRFAPETYFQTHPQVPGLYDADYQPFSFAGQQAVALNSIQTLARRQNIPLVIVNLPLTKEYLDPLRLSKDRQFRQLMQGQTGKGLIFIDLAEKWKTEYKYFADPSHLNRYGAAAVASQLAANGEIPWPETVKAGER